ncbi:non-ribosomal peptide synthetase [Paenibacillus glacialis]|uniref:Non-ribosomal peptide synthetase n=1 Tax=Paenibacillus glacialis TaxID=494026 RepID=A0A162MDN0_9BACL|nr:non-ribosomal peptide synthetase [Paenibacillus glacialis]OAB42663.1 non-ribosomal peptide synthetase [Paenibacillus glacialis]
MSLVHNLSQVLLASLRNGAGITFCEAGRERFMSYGQLLETAQVVLGQLQERGMGVKSYVVLQTEDNERFIVLFWACVLGGMIPVPLTAGRTDEGRRKLLQVSKQLGEPYLLCEPDIWESVVAYCSKNEEDHAVEKLQSRMMYIEEVMEAGVGLGRRGSIYDSTEEDVAVIQFTSGSTGDPKGVVLTHGNLLSNMRAIMAGSQSTEADSSLSWLPLTHDMGLIGFHLTPILGEMNQWQMPTSMFVLHPMKWMELTNKHRITCLSSPNFGYVHFLQHFKAESALHWDLSSVRLIFNGAEPISATHIRQFIVHMKPYGLNENCIFPVYGLAEASLAVTFPHVEERLNTLYLNRKSLNIDDEIQIISSEDPDYIEIVELGFPVLDCNVRVCNEKGKEISDSNVGLVHIKGSNVTKGYFNRPDVNEVTISTDGWLNTGDLGFIRDGRLYVTGRMKDIIFVNGQNVYPHDLEALVSEVNGAEIGKVAICAVQDDVSKQDEIAVFIQYRGKLGGFMSLRDQIQRLLNRRTGFHVKLIVPVRRIPKTTSGKIQRYVLADSMRCGEFASVLAELYLLEQTLEIVPTEEIIVPPSTDSERKILSIWQKVLKRDRIGIDSHFLEHGGNSLRATYVAAQLQEAFGKDISLGELFQHHTVRSLATFIDNMEGNVRSNALGRIEKAESRERYPASSAQRRLYILEEMNPGLLNYHLPQSITIAGKLDLDRFKQSWRLLVGRHAGLRTSFVMEDDRVVQQIAKDVEVPIAYADGREWLDSGIQSRMKSFLQPYSLDKAPLFRIELITLEDERHLMLFDMHHLITDGTAMGILIGEFVALYEGKELPPLPVDYGDIVLWEEATKQDERKVKQQLYWRQLFDNGVPMVNIPTDYLRPLSPSYRGATEKVVLDAKLTTELELLATQTWSTLYAVLVSIYYILLSKYTEADDVVIGTAAAGRTRSEMDGIVGLFVNMVPLRLQVDHTLPLSQCLKKMSGDMMASLDNQEVPYEEIVELAQAKREYGRNPMFDTVFTLQNMELPEFRATEVTFKPAPMDTNTAKFDMSWECVSSEEGIHISIEYALDLYSSETVQQFARHYIALAREAVRYPDAPLIELNLLDTDERSMLMGNSQAQQTPYPRDIPLHRIFERQVSLVPEHIAVVLEEESMTYAELNEAANALARWMTNRGVTQHSRVALVLSRSCDMPIAILAVLKTGSAYVPIDPKYPADRIRFMLQDAGISTLIAGASTTSMCRELLHDSDIDVIDMDARRGEWRKEDNHNLSVESTAQDIAYIMYTSGSTGIPKGILTTHRNVSRVVVDTDYIRLTDEDVLLQLSNYAFDGSTFDLFGALLNGAKLVLVNEEDLLDVDQLIRLIRSNNVSVFFTTTALFNTLVDHGLEELSKLRHILFGGERASAPHVKRALCALGPGVLLHVYGPTESTVFATCYKVEELEPDGVIIPIGQPIAHSEAYVLDVSGNMVPALVPGELCIAGDGVASGYLNMQEMTDSKFIPHPFKAGELLYKTGDLVRRLPDGNLEFMDRMDTQVKLRGFRIELGEIESKLLECMGMREAVVVLKYRDSDPLLCAYVVAGESISIEQLRTELGAKLPMFMIPSAFVQLEKLPLTANGKLNKNALPEPDYTAQGVAAAYVAPATLTEEKVAGIWQQVLKVEAVGVCDHFFEHGGHSLKAATLVSEIYKQCQVRMPIKEIFQRPTVREQAAWIDGASKEAFDPILQVPMSSSYPLSPSQQRIFLIEAMGDVGITYHIPLVLRLTKQVQRSELTWGIRELISLHEPLRTSFRLIGGEACQIVHEQVHFELQETECEENGLEELFRTFVQPLDLAQAPLLDARLVSCESGEAYLFFNLHHIIADGISIGLIMEQLVQLVDGENLEPPLVHYKDYAVWRTKQNVTERLLESDRYWQSQLAAPLPLLDMPLDFPRGERQSFGGETVIFDIPVQLSNRLQELSDTIGVSLNSVLFASYAILLQNYTGQRDLVIGALTAGRTHPDTTNMVGMFNGFLPIRLEVEEVESFIQIAKDAHEQLLAAFEYQETSFDRMIEAAQLSYEPSRNALFDTMLILHNQFDANPEVKGRTWGLQPVPISGNATSKLDFKLDIYGQGSSGLRGELEFNTSLFRRDTMERLAQRLMILLEQVIDHPAESSSSIRLISDMEEQVLLREWNDTTNDYPQGYTIHGMFETQVAKTPDAIAIRSREGTLTYWELNERANRLALQLRNKGVEADSIIPIVAQRSFAMMIGIMGILKAGAAYLPIDPEFPEDRIRYILEDSGATLLCAERRWMDRLSFEGEIVDLEGLEESVQLHSEVLEPISSSRNLAYVIYTSGSTGKPKGVMIEHESVINRLNWMQSQYPIDSQDIILQKTPITFDVSVWELFWWSFVGASVYLLDPHGEKEPQVMMNVVDEESVTVMHFVPSMLGVFLQYATESGRHKPLGDMRYVFTSGEALKPAHVEGFYQMISRGEANTRLINLYGPTEATVDVSAYDCANYSQGSVPIGAPIYNTRLYIVDEQLSLQPIGIPGELCIAGVGLARGYLNRGELTSEKFVTDPFFPGERMYRTGDRARWLSDGNIEYLGRFDHQVKIRGLRIECGEIEHALLQLETISDAIVTTVKDRVGEVALCAYVVTTYTFDERELKNTLKRSLPEYMVPSLFVFMSALPLSASGKTDRNRLPQPTFTDSVGGGEPRSETERRLAELWKHILGVDRVSVDDHFFVLGGHSLRAAQLSGAVEQQLEVAFSLKDVFGVPVLEDMAAFIDAAPRKAVVHIQRAKQQATYPLSLAQNRMFVLHHVNPSGTTYNLPLALKMIGELDMERMQRALQGLIDRHEPLRTSFEWNDGVPVQRIHEDVTLIANVTRVEDVDNADGMQEFIEPFDLQQAPLLRASLITNGEQDHMLLLDMHHIVSDGISMSVLAGDFAALYGGGTLTPLDIQYRDVAVWQQAWMSSDERYRQEQYWQETLSGTLPLLDLPTDRPRSSEQSFAGSKLIDTLPPSLMEEVESLAIASDMTPYHVMLACFHVLLYKMTGQEDIIVGTPIGGRFHPVTEPLVGMFVNTVAIRSEPSGDLTFLKFAEAIKGSVLGAMHNGMLPFEHCVTALDVPRDLSRNPIFDVMFVLQNMETPTMEADKLQLKTCSLEHAVSKLDMTFELAEREGRIDIAVEYATALFDTESIRRMISYYIRIVETVTRDEHIPLCQISLLTVEEEAKQITDFNETAIAYPSQRTVESYLEAQAEWIPHATAVVDESAEISYGELNERANRLARALRKRGVKCEDTVAIMMERSIEMIIAIFGILKAGAAYVPIAPQLPEERIQYMLSDSGATIVLTRGTGIRNLPLGSEILDVAVVLQQEQNGSALEKIHHSRNLAYVLYTSGSTGQPKGVMIEHHSVVNRIMWMQNNYALDMNDVILQKTPITFDVSVWELFWWSFVGAKLCLLEPGGEKDPGAIVNAIAKHAVTTMHFVPSMLHLFMDSPGIVDAGEDLASLRTVFASGEALTVDHVERFRSNLGKPYHVALVNLYGPTEATVDVSYYDCMREGSLTSVPIGKPIDNISLYVVNDALRIQPVGIAGELCISGVGLARGYWRRPDLTNDRFVKNPFVSGGVMYRTGDLARWLPDGNIEYLGRLDHQVKIRGYRIECGEIEHALTNHPSVKEAVVIKREGNAGSSAFLCAYVITEESVTSIQLREHLATTLPDYMIPAFYMELPQMPLSPNGKVDRKALPTPDGMLDTGISYVEVSGDTERTIAVVWGELLGRSDIGANHNFFDVGGESLLLIRVHQRLDELYPGVLKVTDLFNYPTIASLAEYIESHGDKLRLWHWSGIPLRDDCSNEAYAAQWKSSFQLTLDTDLVQGLAKLAESQSVAVESVTLALYLLFWKQQANSNLILLPVATSKGRIAPIEIDFSTVKEFNEMLQVVVSSLNDAEVEYDVQQVKLERGSHDGFSVAPLYVDGSKNSMTAGQELLQVFDIVLTMDINKGTAVKGVINGLLEFNARRLKKEKVKEWAQGYVKLLRMAVHQFQQTANSGTDDN